MNLAKQLKTTLKKSRILRFNFNNRDSWVGAQAARVPASAFVLDVGAGTCPYRHVFAHTRYKTQDFVQLDPSANRDGAHYGQIDYVCEILNIPIEAGTVDVILCTEVLEHVPDPVALIKECARLLRPGGLLLLTAPLNSGLHQEPFHYYGGFTPHWYTRFLPEAGFTIEELAPNGDTFLHYGQFGQYVISRLAPWNVARWAAIPLLPIWLLALPVLGVFVPAASHLAKHVTRDENFAVGYHVRARRLAS